MLSRVFGPLRYLLGALVAGDSPRQLALGFTLGMMIGLVPKGNLVAIGLLLVLLSTRVNLATGMGAAALFSWLGTLADPLSHRIGLALLSAETFQPLGAYLYDLPLVPWTALNNTVVCGSLALGAWLAYPTYRVSHRFFRAWQPWLLRRLDAFRLSHLLTRTEAVADGRA
jgi:uncharacterized protein (TIGR03546 family)